MKEKDYTIVRKRIVTQISTEQVRAVSEEKALKIINDLHIEEESNGAMEDYNEWHNLDDVIDYPILTKDAVLECNEVE